MEDSNSPIPELLESVLDPLLDDFEYWFARSRQLLENEKISFMSDDEQQNLLGRVTQAQAELSTSKMLFAATDKKVGIDMATLIPWHHLLGECWRVSMRYHQHKHQ
ncbi:MAG: DUF2605 domain-containing protein [Sphaerospermopsis sp. SIO1G2]|nr:DUF2605 domain-containing protein [Sphaerospermopsis sp. SIO1G1]NET72223.1 DUF2605 domain-containing protein [Sphaerospermopsis sp. SIO1G2]